MQLTQEQLDEIERVVWETIPLREGEGTAYFCATKQRSVDDARATIREKLKRNFATQTEVQGRDTMRIKETDINVAAMAGKTMKEIKAMEFFGHLPESERAAAEKELFDACNPKQSTRKEDEVEDEAGGTK